MRSKWFPGPRSQVAGLLLLLATAYSLQPTACFAQIHPHSFSPRMLGGSLQLWLRADAITGLTDGSPVATWPDSSGHGRDAIQGTPTAQPAYKINVQNGRPVVRPNAASQQYVTSPFAPALNQPFTAFALISLTDSTARDMAFIGQTGAQLCIDPPWGGMQFWAGNILLPNPAVNAPFVMSSWSLVANGASSWIRINGSNLRTGNAGDLGIGTAVDVGGYSSNASDTWHGDLGEILFFGIMVSDYDRQRIERYLLRKWGL